MGQINCMVMLSCYVVLIYCLKLWFRGRTLSERAKHDFDKAEAIVSRAGF